MFLAANIKKKKVLLLEKMKVPGKKILISGGGMCNLSNCDDTDSFLTHFGNKKKSNFLKPALMNFSTVNLQNWYGHNGLPLILRDDGKVFPQSLKAKSVVDFLLTKSRENFVEIKTGQNVIEIKKNVEQFTVITENSSFSSSKIVITTGGKSYESTGSDGAGYGFARSFGHKIIEPTQALVAVNITDYGFSELAGNSIKGSAVDFFRENDSKRYLSAQGDLLFTHKGVSGPVILNNSREIKKNDLLRVSLIPTENKEQSRVQLHKAFTEEPKKPVRSILKSLGVFSGLSDSLIFSLHIKNDEKCSNFNKKSRIKLISLLLDFPLPVSGKGYFSSAMVTAGGVDLSEINRRTMESKLVRNLYFAGEVLDIDGHTGGYNLQAAFSTAKLIADTIN